MALVLLVNRDLLRNRYMILLGAMLFFASAIDFSYYARNSYDAFMYNQILSVQFAVLFAVLGSWLLFNPSLKDPARRSHASRSFHPRVPIKDGLPSLDLAHAQAAPSESEPTTSLAAGETAPPTT